MAEPKAAVTQLERQKGKVGFNIRPPPPSMVRTWGARALYLPLWAAK